MTYGISHFFPGGTKQQYEAGMIARRRRRIPIRSCV